MDSLKRSRAVEAVAGVISGLGDTALSEKDFAPGATANCLAALSNLGRHNAQALFHVDVHPVFRSVASIVPSLQETMRKLDAEGKDGGPYALSHVCSGLRGMALDNDAAKKTFEEAGAHTLIADILEKGHAYDWIRKNCCDALDTISIRTVESVYQKYCKKNELLIAQN